MKLTASQAGSTTGGTWSRITVARANSIASGVTQITSLSIIVRQYALKSAYDSGICDDGTPMNSISLRWSCQKPSTSSADSGPTYVRYMSTAVSTKVECTHSSSSGSSAEYGVPAGK